MIPAIAASPVGRDRITFSDIAAPLEPDDFISRYWAQEAVLLRTPGRDFSTFCGWDAVNAILNAGDCTFGQIKVSRGDAPVPTELFTADVNGQQLVDVRAVVNLFREGASFGLTHADSHWPPLRPIIDCFQDALLESVHTNVYCSPPFTQGFRCHYDLHEVFILQVEGTKHWRVFRPFVHEPVEPWRVDDAQEVLKTDPYVNVILQKGDVLYVPRGHWHYAVAQDSPSLHVTVGVKCRRATAFLDWLSGELFEERTWRRNAPLIGTVATAGEGVPASAVFTRWVGELARSLIERLADPTLSGQFLKAIVKGVQPAYTIDMPLQGLAGPVSLDRVVFERPGSRPHIFEQTGPSNAVVTVAGAEIELEGVNPATVSRIFASSSFTFADLKRWDSTMNPNEFSDLLNELVRSGLLMTRRIAD